MHMKKKNINLQKKRNKTIFDENYQKIFESIS